ncbi:hypothetical protein HanHA300_Chr16g0621581 [Helianthus annuus]|nr:hypothetical protein HanHA300_Chr16g0621581 [Helianthus annuus]KAJ0461458.1 hypothetical protein HanHA89_Chr16g0672481 [Helianthus annuus]
MRQPPQRQSNSDRRQTSNPTNHTTGQRKLLLEEILPNFPQVYAKIHAPFWLTSVRQSPCASLAHFCTPNPTRRFGSLRYAKTHAPFWLTSVSQNSRAFLAHFYMQESMRIFSSLTTTPTQSKLL